MQIVFDEIVTEVSPPSTDTTGEDSADPGAAASNPAPTDGDMLRTLERIQKRQLRLFAD